MKTPKITPSVLFVLFITVTSYSQNTESIHIGPAFPVLDFDDTKTPENGHGGAATGLNIGLQFSHQFSESGFGLFGGVDLVYNGLKQEFKDNLKFRLDPLLLDPEEATYSEYMNFPISAGVNYYSNKEHFGIFANAGLTFNILKITDMEVKINEEILMQHLAMSHQIGYKIGGGFLFNKRWIVSADYLALGKHTIENHVNSGTHYGTLRNEDIKLKVSILGITLGYKF